MKKMSFVVLVAVMAFAANVFAQEAVKPAGQDQTKTTEVKKEMKAGMKKEGKAPKKHHMKGKKAAKKEEAAPEKK